MNERLAIGLGLLVCLWLLIESCRGAYLSLILKVPITSGIMKYGGSDLQQEGVINLLTVVIAISGMVILIRTWIRLDD